LSGTDRVATGETHEYVYVLDAINRGQGVCEILAINGGFAQKVTKALFSVQPLCSLCLCG